MNEYKLKHIPLNRIKIEENTRLDTTSNHELIASIKQHGVLQPAGVYKKGAYHYLIWGNRRFNASKKIRNVTSLPCVIVAAGTDEKKFLVLNLTENMQRREITPHEQGRGFKELRDKHKMNSKEIAASLGISDGIVLRNLRLFEGLPKQLVKDLAPFKGRQADSGYLAPMVASKIIKVNRAQKLTKQKQNMLYKFGKSGRATPEKVGQIARLMETGTPLKTAISKVSTSKPVTISFAMDRRQLAKLVKKYKKSVETILGDKLKKDPEIKKCLIV